MKSAVIYYSHYGNVACVANEFVEVLKRFGGVDSLEIEYKKNSLWFMRKVFYRLFPGLIRLAPIKTDLKEYDVIFFGVPVWGGRPSAPVLKYLRMCRNIRNKRIFCFYVYGIDRSARICAEFVKRVLRHKSNSPIENVFIPWTNVQDVHFMNDVFKQILLSLDIQP